MDETTQKDASKLLDEAATAAGVTGGTATPRRSEKKKFAKSEESPPRRTLQMGEGTAVLTPAGKPPVKPSGFPWPDGQEATDEDIRSWAEQVYSAGIDAGIRYAPEAVVYYARYFWKLNSDQYKRVRRIILGD